MKEVARTGGGRALLLEALRIVGATIGQTLVHDGTEFVPADAPATGIPEPSGPEDGDVLVRAGGAWTAVPGVGVLGTALAAALTIDGQMIVRAGGLITTLLSGATGRALLAAATKAAARDELDVYSVDETNTLARDAETFAVSLAAALAGASLTLRDQDVATVIEATSLADGPLAAPGLPMTYTAGVLTAGVAMDLAGAGLPLGTSVAWRFGSSDRERTGVYTVTDEGANDPGGHAPTFTRRADFAASGDFATGDAVRVADSGGLLRVAVPDPFTLDTDPMKLDAIDPAWIFNRGFLALLAPASGDAPEGRTLLADGAGYWRWTSDPVSALLAAASLSAARTALGVETTPVVVTADRTAAEGEVLFVDATAGSVTITLPAAAGARRPIRVKKTDVSANAVTVDGAGAELVDGAATLTLTTQFEAVTLHADGVASWGEF